MRSRGLRVATVQAIGPARCLDASAFSGAPFPSLVRWEGAVSTRPHTHITILILPRPSPKIWGAGVPTLGSVGWHPQVTFTETSAIRVLHSKQAIERGKRGWFSGFLRGRFFIDWEGLYC